MKINVINAKRSMVACLAHGKAKAKFSIPGYPGTINCYKWTAEAVIAGMAYQFIPMK